MLLVMTVTRATTQHLQSKFKANKRKKVAIINKTRQKDNKMKQEHKQNQEKYRKAFWRRESKIGLKIWELHCEHAKWHTCTRKKIPFMSRPFWEITFQYWEKHNTAVVSSSAWPNNVPGPVTNRPVYTVSKDDLVYHYKSSLSKKLHKLPNTEAKT